MQTESSRQVDEIVHGDRLKPFYGVVGDPFLKRLWVPVATAPTVSDRTGAYEGVAALFIGSPNEVWSMDRNGHLYIAAGDDESMRRPTEGRDVVSRRNDGLVYSRRIFFLRRRLGCSVPFAARRARVQHGRQVTGTCCSVYMCALDSLLDCVYNIIMY